MKCGCRTRIRAREKLAILMGLHPFIAFCPLHAAAVEETAKERDGWLKADNLLHRQKVYRRILGVAGRRRRSSRVADDCSVLIDAESVRTLLTERGSRMLAMLKRLERGEEEFNLCPACEWAEVSSHSPDCELAALLARAEGRKL